MAESSSNVVYRSKNNDNMNSCIQNVSIESSNLNASPHPTRPVCDLAQRVRLLRLMPRHSEEVMRAVRALDHHLCTARNYAHPW